MNEWEEYQKMMAGDSAQSSEWEEYQRMTDGESKGVFSKAVDAVKSFDESQSKGATTGVNLNLVGRMGLNPITDKSATMTGTEAERFALNLISDPLRMGIGLIDQAVANPYEAVAGLVKAPIHILGNLYKGVFGTDEQKEQALQETINSPLSPLAVAAPAMGIAGRAMTPASLRGIDIAGLQRTAAEARATSPIPEVAPIAKDMRFSTANANATPMQMNMPPRMQPEVSPKMQVQMNRGVSETDPSVPKTDPVVSKSTPPVASAQGRGKPVSNPPSAPEVTRADVIVQPVRVEGESGKRRIAFSTDLAAKKGGAKVPVVETPKEAIGEIIEGRTESKIGTAKFKEGMLARLDDAIAKAPDKVADGMVTIEIPGDGSFRISNIKESLIQVRDKVSKLTDKKGIVRENQGFGYNAKGEYTIITRPEYRQSGPEAPGLQEGLASGQVKFVPNKKGGDVTLREAGLRPQVLAEKMPEPVRRLLYSAEGRVKLPESKALFSGIEESTKIQKANLEGPWMEETRSTGLGKLTHEDAARISTELESGNAGVVTGQRKIFNLVPAGKVSVATERIRKVLEDVWTQAKAAGIEIGKVKNYFPRIIKREVAELIDDDLRSVVAELEKSENVSDVAVAKALESAHTKTRQIIQHMIDTKQAKGYNDAVKNLYYAAQHDLYKVTSFEKHRSLATELPSWVYETDARQVIPMYIEAMSKRIADARVFGPDGERAQPLIDAIKSKDMKEAQLVEEVYRTHAGLQQQLHPMSHVPRKTIDALTGFLYGTKITVKSTIPNLIQTLHSVGKDYGMTRWIRAVWDLSTNKKLRSEIRRSGVVDLDMVQAMSGYHPGGVWGKFADITTKFQGFKHANRMNQYISASMAKVFIEEAYAKVNGQKNVWFGPKRVEWFKQELADLGIDYTKPLDDAAVARAMYKVASDTQLMHNILKEPVWMNNQRLRVLALFKRFAYRQAKYQVDTLTKEFRRQNYIPALRLAAQGYLAAQFTGWANDMLRKALSGENVYSDNEGWRKFIEAMAQVGAVGVFSDIAMGLTTQTPTKSVIDKTKFALTPVAVDAAMKGYDVASKTAGDIDKLGTGPALRKNVDEILQFISPVLGYAGDRMLTQREQSYRDVYRKANKKNEILDVILMGDAERAKRMIQRWNEANKNNPALVITGKDINGKAVKNRAENKAKSQAGVR